MIPELEGQIITFMGSVQNATGENGSGCRVEYKDNFKHYMKNAITYVFFFGEVFLQENVSGTDHYLSVLISS